MSAAARSQVCCKKLAVLFLLPLTSFVSVIKKDFSCGSQMRVYVILDLF